MNWDAISSIAEIVGAIGVILSLLYVGRELRQSNAMARTATRQEINATTNSWAMGIATSPTLSEGFAKVHYQDFVRDDASDVEKIRLAYALFALISNQHYIYEQWKEGILNEIELDERLGPGSVLLTRPYLRSVWPLLKSSYPSDFADWYEKRYQLGDEG